MSKRFIDAWARVCLTYRKTILVALAAITLLTASALPRVRFENALDIWFLEGEPALEVHQRLIATYGSDELIVIGLEAPDVFVPEVLERVGRVTRAVQDAPHVEKVFSLTTVEAIVGRDESIEVRSLVELPLDAAKLAKVRPRALNNELYAGNVVSRDGRFTVIVARLPHRTDSLDYKVETVGAIREILAREGGPGFFLAGGPTIDAEFFRLSQADSGRTTGLMIVLLAVMLWLLLRTASGVILPLVTVITATVWTIGSMVLLGIKVNVVTTLLPPLLLAVGVADAMHVLVEYQNRCGAGESKPVALRAVYHELLGPLFLASLTTAIGMFSLTVSRMQGIRELGAFSAFGVAVAFLLTATFVPIALSYLPVPARLQTPAREALWSARALERIHAFTVTRGRTIVTLAAIVSVLSVFFATRIRAESAFLKMFKSGAVVRTDTERIQESMGGTVTMDVLLDTGKADGVTDPAVLHAMAELETFLRQQPNVTATQSIVGYLKDLRLAFFAGDARQRRLPETREEAAQYLLLYEMDAPDGDINELVTPDHRQARVNARVVLETSNTAVTLIRDTRAYLARHLPAGVDGTVAGLIVLIAGMHEYVRDSLVRGFGSALVLIFLVFCVQMRSVRLGALVMVANSMPIVVALGAMGLLGIRLDSMTAMVASIAIGLTDDDSIHFVSRVRSRLEAGVDVVGALHETLVEVGRALVYTGLALCAGFAVMLTSSFVGAIYFGGLVMLAIIVALISDLFLLPVLLRWEVSRARGVSYVEPLAKAAGQ